MKQYCKYTDADILIAEICHIYLHPTFIPMLSIASFQIVESLCKQSETKTRQLQSLVTVR